MKQNFLTSTIDEDHGLIDANRWQSCLLFAESFQSLRQWSAKTDLEMSEAHQNLEALGLPAAAIPDKTFFADVVQVAQGFVNGTYARKDLEHLAFSMRDIYMPSVTKVEGSNEALRKTLKKNPLVEAIENVARVLAFTIEHSNENGQNLLLPKEKERLRQLLNSNAFVVTDQPHLQA